MVAQVVVGRKDGWSFPGGPLKGLQHCHFNADYQVEGVEVVSSAEEALRLVADEARRSGLLAELHLPRSSRQVLLRVLTGLRYRS